MKRFIKVVLYCAAAMVLAAPWFMGKSDAGSGPDQPFFTDISESSGLKFVHFNGMTGKYYFPEMTGQGGGFVDFDNDGDLDVYLLQGCIMGPDETLDDALYPPTDSNPRDRLFRNDLSVDSQGNRVVTFTDVTDSSNINGTGYGMGLATGDFNNDGWPDLYITNYGPNKMLYNNGDGTFRDVTEQTGTGDDLWGSSAMAFDYDRDGWLDLYVANYVLFDVAVNKTCYASNSRRDYCGPSAFESQNDRLFHNRGDGTFEEVTRKMLEGYEPGSGLGVISMDVNNDGWLDIYVTNDGQPNQLWVNQNGTSFLEDALFSGSAVNQNGQAEASMGVGAGDFDNDGDEDLIMTHIMGETNTLYVNDGQGFFEDRTIALGLSAISFPYTAFGVNWIDYDNDGWLDLLMVNGAVLVIEQLVLAGDPYPLHQPNLLFQNLQGKRFADVTAAAGDAFRLSEVSRGASFGDIDNDGDTDVLICNNNGPVRLLRNDVGNTHPWLGVRLVHGKHRSDALGARVALKRKGRPVLWRQVRTEGSYCSSNDPRILFGLGDTDAVETLDIYWPDGSRDQWKDPSPMAYTTIEQGKVNPGD